MFTAEELRSLLRIRPFTAFRLHLSDGGHLDVLSPEAVLVTRRCAVVGLMDPASQDPFADRWVVAWYMHVTRVEMLVPGSPPFSPPPGEPSPSPA
jgi:hypothetical protein